MKCELEGNILHIKSDMFENPEIVKCLEENFTFFLSLYFEHFKVSGISMLIRDWKHLKNDFENSLDAALMAKIITDVICS